GAELLRWSFLACVSSHNVALHGFQIHPRYEQRRVSVGANIQTLVASARLLLPRESVIAALAGVDQFFGFELGEVFPIVSSHRLTVFGNWIMAVTWADFFDLVEPIDDIFFSTIDVQIL